VVGVVGFDKFDRSVCLSRGIDVVPGIRVSWSLVVEVCVNFDVYWEIVLLSPEDLDKVITECSI